MLVELDHVFAFHELIHLRGNEQRRDVYVAHPLYGLKLLDIETEVLPDLFP